MTADTCIDKISFFHCLYNPAQNLVCSIMPVNFIQNLKSFYIKMIRSAADLFVFPSTYDTSGLVVKEAAACSCPSVLVAGSCAGEDVEDKVSGFLCEENADSCARTILDAICDPTRLKAVGEEASRSVYYSWDDAVKAARERYEVIIERRKAKKHFWQK